ncbi:MAG: peptide ABC transporter permease [Dethiosulfovibrio peptidovorans]|nr:MAG: peptide ABC transporter permease [Dethiosulfovibrio peptidovorans]
MRSWTAMPYTLKAGLVLFAIVLLAVTLAGTLSPYDPVEQEPMNRLKPPSTAHLLGTDAFGRDILSRLLHGGRATLTASISALLVAMAIGCSVGMIAGMYGGIVETILMRLVDTLMAFPFIVLAIIVTALFGTGFFHLLLTIVSVWWVPFARLARSIALNSKNDVDVSAAKILGASTMTIIRREIFPRVVGQAVVLGTFELGSLIISISALSFFGLGSKPPAPEWGSMLADSKAYFFRAPHMLLGPTLCIFLTVLALNLIGEGMRDRFDPFEIPVLPENRSQDGRQRP